MTDFLKDKIILVVEDDDLLREAVVMEMEFNGARVLSANSGNDAFEIVKNQKVDAIISDIRMANGNGIELLKNIKEFNVETPVLMFMTGFSDLSLADAYHLGAEAVLTKPFDLDDLHHCLERIITPKEIRWNSDEPCKTMTHNLEWKFHSFGLSLNESKFVLGRGGFFVPLDEIKYNINISDGVIFKIHFETGPVSIIEGCGTIRFLKGQIEGETEKSGYGVEFDHIPPETTKILLDLALKNKVKPYIPCY